MNAQQIMAAFPKLFHQTKPNLMITNYGFQCGAGWNPIIHKLCVQLNGLAEECKLTDEKWPYFLQIKEKFGTLRAYIDASGFRDEASQDKVRDFLEQASLASSITCENCGQPGSLRDTGWIHTYCDDCHADYLARLNDA